VNAPIAPERDKLTIAGVSPQTAQAAQAAQLAQSAARTIPGLFIFHLLFPCSHIYTAAGVMIRRSVQKDCYNLRNTLFLFPLTHSFLALYGKKCISI